MSSTRHRRAALFTAVLVLVMLALLELVSFAAIGVLEQQAGLRFTPISERNADLALQLRELLDVQGRSLVELDEELGWRHRPSYRSSLYNSNSRGARGTRDYPPQPRPGVVRIAAFGDSYVHGNEVADAEVWSARVEANRPDVEVWNQAVGGYGTDQALLAYRRAKVTLAADIVLLGFADVNYQRNVNRSRRFITPDQLPLFKPRFLAPPDGGLVLVPSPFPTREALEELVVAPELLARADEHEWFFEPLEWRNPLYDHWALARLSSTLLARSWRSRGSANRLYAGDQMNRDCEALRVLTRIVDTFAREASSQGAKVALVIFPARDSDIWGEGPRSYAPFLEGLDGVAVIDMADAIAGDPGLSPGSLRQPGGHYSPNGNATVARAIETALVERGWLPARP